MYVFDAALMFAVMTILNVMHPGEIGDLLKGNRPGSGAEAAPDSEMQAFPSQHTAGQKDSVQESDGS